VSNNKPFRILAVNPGSTSTKIALFEGENKLFSKNVEHEAEELKKYAEISDQLPYRRDTILSELDAAGIRLDDVDAFAGRGGGLAACDGGTYEVNERLYEHAKLGFTVKHPATLGAQLAKEFAEAYGGKAYVVNPPDVDEFIEVARITGLKGVYRESRIHALNQKEIGIRYAAAQGRKYEDLNLIICHIGGGVSVTAHNKGKMIDSNDIAQGDGPMAPTRCGSIPLKDIIKMCFSGDFTEKQMQSYTTKDGGWVNHLGTVDAREVMTRIVGGDSYAKLVYDATIYQIAKYAGSCAAALKGKVDAVILTGGISNDKYLVENLKAYISFLAPVVVIAGEFEMEALAAGAIRVLKGEEMAKEYTGIPVWNGFKEGDPDQI
jgi:butyrate kinase